MVKCEACAHQRARGGAGPSEDGLPAAACSMKWGVRVCDVCQRAVEELVLQPARGAPAVSADVVRWVAVAHAMDGPPPIGPGAPLAARVAGDPLAGVGGGAYVTLYGTVSAVDGLAPVVTLARGLPRSALAAEAFARRCLPPMPRPPPERADSDRRLAAALLAAAWVCALLEALPALAFADVAPGLEAALRAWFAQKPGAYFDPPLSMRDAALAAAAALCAAAPALEPADLARVAPVAAREIARAAREMAAAREREAAAARPPDDDAARLAAAADALRCADATVRDAAKPLLAALRADRAAAAAAAEAPAVAVATAAAALARRPADVPPPSAVAAAAGVPRETAAAAVLDAAKRLLRAGRISHDAYDRLLSAAAADSLPSASPPVDSDAALTQNRRSRAVLDFV